MIDTILLKASYDLMPKEAAMAYAVRKLAADIEQGKGLESVKLTRFVTGDSGSGTGWDFLKFNFPVCGNISSADLMTIHAALEGFKVYVVGNEERRRRTRVIQDTLVLENIFFVPELDTPVEQEYGRTAQRTLSFVNTQERGFRAVPERTGALVLEVAADQPLLYDFYRHALDLSKPNVDFAMNLNAVNLMQVLVPSFVRNGYDRTYNSRGQAVTFKENNVHAQNHRSQEANRNLFNALYANRNNGHYLKWWRVVKNLGVKLPEKLLRCAVRPDNLLVHGRELVHYGLQRGNGDFFVSYATLQGVFNFFVSHGVTRNAVYIDATNDDIFSCWDMDGLNNDFVGYKRLFDRNYGSLEALLPYAQAVYEVDAALARADGFMTAMRFRDYFNSYVAEINRRLHDPAYLRSIGIKDDTIDRLASVTIEAEIGQDMRIQNGVPATHLDDLELYLAGHYFPEFRRHEEKYRRSMPQRVTAAERFLHEH